MQLQDLELQDSRRSFLRKRITLDLGVQEELLLHDSSDGCAQRLCSLLPWLEHWLDQPDGGALDAGTLRLDRGP